MIIDAKTIIITIIFIFMGGYIGLRLIRSFALTIAQENHAANVALDTADEVQRSKRLREADEMVASAFSNVEPLVTEKQKKKMLMGDDDGSVSGNTRKSMEVV